MLDTPGQSEKNIVICCDGTGNEFGECNSNVVKLYSAMIVNNEQVGYYNPGVGTMGAPNKRTRLGKAWSIVEGLAFGAGFMDNVESAYRYLMQQYNDGDRIYLFGFSRGSYTVRALAGILHAYGLLCRGNEGDVPYVLHMFMDDVQKARGKGKTSVSIQYAFKETFCHDVTLHFVGLWDTVSSIGWIYSPIRLLYSAQNPIVQTGRHAVSIDERRCFYTDNLWGPPLARNQTPTLQKSQDILQVWFAGVHSDVGGSYKQSESALSNIALNWVLSEAEAAGLKVNCDRVRMIFGQPTQQKHAAAQLFAPPAQPGIVHRSLKGLWWLLEILPHRYYDEDDGKEKWRIPLGRARRVPNEAYVHSSVFNRMNNPPCKYHPKNLKSGEMVRLTAGPTVSGHSGSGTPEAELYIYKFPKESAYKTGAKLLLAAALAAGLSIAVAAIAMRSKFSPTL